MGRNLSQVSQRKRICWKSKKKKSHAFEETAKEGEPGKVFPNQKQ